MKIKVDYKELKRVNKENIRARREGFNPFKDIFELGLMVLSELGQLLFALLILILSIVILPLTLLKRYTEIFWLPTFYNLRLRMRLIFRRKKWLALAKLRINDPERKKPTWLKVE